MVTFPGRRGSKWSGAGYARARMGPATGGRSWPIRIPFGSGFRFCQQGEVATVSARALIGSGPFLAQCGRCRIAVPGIVRRRLRVQLEHGARDIAHGSRSIESATHPGLPSCSIVAGRALHMTRIDMVRNSPYRHAVATVIDREARDVQHT